MKFRLAEKKDIKDIMEIINQGKEKLKAEKIEQWQNGYPNDESIEQDIKDGYSYLVENDGEIIATASLSFDGEKNYENLYEGKWLTEDKYCVMHRVCVNLKSETRNKGKILLDYTEKLSKENGIFSIKIDTHEENSSMRNLLEKNEFEYCGFTYLPNKEKRVVYEKLLK